MARQYMTKPMRISAADPEDASKTKASIRQVVYRAHHLDKDEMIGRILRATGRGRTIIFTKTKRDAARVAEASQPRIPTLLLRDLLAAHRQGHITLRPVAALLGMSTNDLRAQLTKTEGE